MMKSRSEILRALTFYRRGGVVKRFHLFDVLKENTVGHHTFNVLALLVTCVGEDTITKELILAALQHDLPEQETGDIPAPFKRKIPGLREQVQRAEQNIIENAGLTFYERRLSEEERTWLNLADSLEGALYCGDEYQRGNLPMRQIGQVFLGYVRDILATIEASDDMDDPDYCPVKGRFQQVLYEATRRLI
jgi:5'-deoxynucleotidase YfbR-like HD superfamily hydrolase